MILKIITTIVTIITLLLLAGLVVFLMLPFGLHLKKHLPVPEMSDKEVSGLLEALRLPDTTKISAMRVVFLKDGEDIGMSGRVRIDREQLDEIIRESWMESHQVEASKFGAFYMMLPPMYKIDWWELFPLQAGDRRFYLPLELPLRSYPGSIRAVVRKVGSDVTLYFMYSASIEHFPPVVLEAMRRGRSPDPGFPSQTHMYEVRKGELPTDIRPWEYQKLKGFGGLSDDTWVDIVILAAYVGSLLVGLFLRGNLWVFLSGLAGLAAGLFGDIILEGPIIGMIGVPIRCVILCYIGRFIRWMFAATGIYPSRKLRVPPENSIRP